MSHVRLAVTLSAIILTATADAASKIWVNHTYQLGERVPIHEGLFSLSIFPVFNKGLAFSFMESTFASTGQAIPIAVMLVCLVFFIWFSRKFHPQSFLEAIAPGLVIGGAVGNLSDRFVYEGVLDFIDVTIDYKGILDLVNMSFGITGWTGTATFNVADIILIFGILVLIFRADESPAPVG